MIGIVKRGRSEISTDSAGTEGDDSRIGSVADKESAAASEESQKSGPAKRYKLPQKLSERGGNRRRTFGEED
jgi:hypothetical protein